MKLKSSFLAFGSSALFAVVAYAVPFIDTQVIQNGEDVTLNWSVSGGDASTQGLALFVTAYDDARARVTGIFLGMWGGGTGSLQGTMSAGWITPTIETTNGYSFGPNSHTSQIFSSGLHQITGLLFGAGSELPTQFSPDGPYGGRGGVWTNASSYSIGELVSDSDGNSGGAVGRVPDTGSTVAYVAGGLALTVLLVWRKRRFKPAHSPAILA